MRINAAQQHDNTKPRNKSKNARKKKNLPKSEINSQPLPPQCRTADNSRWQLQYNADTFAVITEQIAVSGDPIMKIIRDNGINPSTYYWWIANNEALSEQLRQARVVRAARQFDIGMDEMMADMDRAICDNSIDFATKKAILQGYRIKENSLRWRIERGNPREFSPKMEIDSRITVDAGHEREQAWSARQRTIREADCEIVDTGVDTDKQEHNNINEIGHGTRD